MVNPDKPTFDSNAFEAAALARGDEFVKGVRRLARLEVEDLYRPNTVGRGATYAMANGGTVDVLHETFDGIKQQVLVRTRITNPALIISGQDGLLRRVTVARHIGYQSFEEEVVPPIDPDAPMVLKTDHDLEMEERFEAALEEMRTDRLELYADPDFQPPELISARTKVTVECQLPQSPNFRTELLSTRLPIDTRLAHITARRQAGEEPAEPRYSVPEHKFVMGVLSELKPRRAQPLVTEFESEWVNPPMMLDHWRPDRNR